MGRIGRIAHRVESAEVTVPLTAPAGAAAPTAAAAGEAAAAVRKGKAKKRR